MAGIAELEVKQLRKAENEGYIAAKRGKSNIDNPYFEDQGLSEAWNDGWFQYQDDHNEEY